MGGQGSQPRGVIKRRKKGRKPKSLQIASPTASLEVSTGPKTLKICPSPPLALKMEPIVGSSNIARALPEEKAAEKPKRFIAFIGNLPFSANDETIKKHFVSLKPISIRHSTDKNTGKSRGFAFVEFAGYDRLKTCLKVYHHSMFDDGASPPRKINVELTAGGGGSSSVRKSKLLVKNKKLNQERTMRTSNDSTVSKENLPPVAETCKIHPSRRTMIKG